MLLRAFIRLLQRSRIALVAFLVVCVVALGTLIDVGINGGKAYPGVHVGTMDVSGKTQEEIQSMVSDAYQQRLETTSVTIYASEEAKQLALDETARAQNEALAEQLSVEDVQATTTHWTTNASSLGATLHADEIARQAYEVGRSNGGVFARLCALFGGWIVDPTLEYAQAEVESLASQIDLTIGNPRVDYGVQIADGQASVTEGNDGMMVDRSVLQDSISHALLVSDDPSFIAEAVYTPLRIDRDKAQAVCDRLNDVISKGIALDYQGSTWQLESAQTGSILSTRIDQDGDSWKLTPFVDENQARALILSQAKEHYEGTVQNISFSKGDDGSITVNTDGTGTMPLAAEGVTALNSVLFDGVDSIDVAPHEGVDPDVGVTRAWRDGATGLVTVSLAMAATPATLSFDDALNAGIVSKISSFTTQYTNSAGTENRNHNIHLVSDLLNNSTVAPDETWSFNGTSGNCNAEAGFLGAGVISDGVYTEDVGGGICQVATTVFNAVYEAGLPINLRFNHSLYIASYPAGRDAAVSWPDLDLKWSNDTSGDILVRMSYDETSVTCALFGVSPGYTVSTEVGEWEKGEEYKIIVKEDPDLAQGQSYVQTAGSDGRSISVVRTVHDSHGNLVRQDRFDSVYDPSNEVIVAGPGTEVDTERHTDDNVNSGS